LIVVDGCVAQVNAAHRSLKQLGVEVPIIGLAKEEENIYVVGGEKPLNLPTGSEALYLLQRLRDEAHRFAVTYHRKLREALA
ncbi:MAG: excinuclease ABC subunit C, partial [Candidatus Bathyarchaeia archaeon]